MKLEEGSEQMFNNEVFNNFAVQAAAIIPIITAIVQAFKLTNWIKERYTPFIAMLVGVGITFLLVHDATADVSSTVLLGILFGLASSGLYSGLQHTAAIIKAEKAEKQARADKRKEEAQKMDNYNKI